MTPVRILFIEQDAEIRELAQGLFDQIQAPAWEWASVKTMDEAVAHLKERGAAAILIDAIGFPLEKILSFVRTARSIQPEAKMTALVGFIDMILDDELKGLLAAEGVKVQDKLETLQAAPFLGLLQSLSP